MSIAIANVETQKSLNRIKSLVQYMLGEPDLSLTIRIVLTNWLEDIDAILRDIA